MIQFRGTHTVRRNFYVDDCLKSVPSESEAICLTADLGRLLERGGFNLTKGILNSCKLIKSLPESHRAGSFKDLYDSQMLVERALGVRWDVEITYSVTRSKSTTSPSQEEDHYLLVPQYMIRSGLQPL